MSAFARRPRTRSARRAGNPSIAAIETLEDRVLLSASPIGGLGNNVANPEWGTAGVDFLRVADAEYTDGVSSIAGQDRPSAREISNVLADQDEDIVSDRFLSAMIYAWGQFIDHDIDLTFSGGTEPLSAAVPTGDPFFDPLSTGTKTISTTRSVFDPTTGTSTSNPREQVNAITAFIDGSMVYGSDAATAASLRTMSGGKLKTSAGNLLPEDASTAGNPTGTMFLAGDIRVNENVELIALQTLFVREHNFWAGKFAAQNPRLTDQQLYDKARERVIGEIQAITYNEWLPALLGQGALDRYQGYNATVNPGIANEFATAGFRVGHSMLGDDVEFLNNNGIAIRDEVSLAEAFFNPNLVRETGIDSILKYLASDPSSEIDTKVVDSVRNFLFGPPGAGGLDLATLNILRGRDHGLADYNSVRESYGLPRVTSFAQISSDAEVQQKLEQLYGTVDNIDLWVGGLAENHVAGASVGETFRAIISDQFERLRDGDRFFYQNQLSGKELKDVQQTTLTDILKRNTTLTNVQENSFFFNSSISGTVFADANRNGRQDGREQGAAGASINLIDTLSNEIVATATTDARGRYELGVDDGLRTGVYKVQATLANGTAGPETKTIAITRGGQFLQATSLALAAPTTPGRGNSTGQSGGASGHSNQGAAAGQHANVDLTLAGSQGNGHQGGSQQGGGAAQNRNANAAQADAQRGATTHQRRMDALFARGPFRGLMSDLT